ncbi:unnamed protein product [Clavelina lepadiformis]|uniref:GT23 domain-containing protein n=1 Tax=Clavelina lepadiformis TaxID=159417 RepID=A0ABP0G5K8_CLALP
MCKVKRQITELRKTYNKIFSCKYSNGSSTHQSLIELKNHKLKSFSKVVQVIIHEIQSRKNCKESAVYHCTELRCGLGCTMHQIASCMMTSLSMNRSLVLAYNSRGSFGVFQSRRLHENVFLPISPGCNFANEPDGIAVHRPPKYWEFNMTTFPSFVREGINQLHPLPMSWWVGQVMTYLMRLQPDVEEDIIRKLELGKPYVGLHIRRSDKLLHEAGLHDVDGYMAVVERWFEKYETLHTRAYDRRRRAYLATDDLSVLREIIERYPDYEIVYNNESITSAANTRERGNEASMKLVLADIFALTRANYVVCTFSSNICRLVYELMQTIHGDATDFLFSLDRSYNFHKRTMPTFHRVVLQHEPQQKFELELAVGDNVLPISKIWATNTWTGRNIRTGKTGTYPDYKVKVHSNVN